jgi:hypothetical protein
VGGAAPPGECGGVNGGGARGARRPGRAKNGPLSSSGPRRVNRGEPSLPGLTASSLILVPFVPATCAPKPKCPARVGPTHRGRMRRRTRRVAAGTSARPAGQSAALALGRLGDAKAVPALTTMCRSLRGQGDLLQFPVDALARIGGSAAVDALAELFRHEDAGGRSLFAGAMGDVAAPGVVGPLVGASTDESWTVRHAAHEALRKLPHPILVEGLAGALVTADPIARRQAAHLVPYYADESMCRLLADMASREPDSEVATPARRAEEVYRLETSYG